MKFWLSISVFITSFIEGTLIFLPLTLVLLVLRRSIILAFFSGLLLDVLQVRPLGVTSLFFLVILAAITLYKKKLSIENPVFVSLVVFVSSFVYSLTFNRDLTGSFYQGLILTFLVAAYFLMSRILTKKVYKRSL